MLTNLHSTVVLTHLSVVANTHLFFPFGFFGLGIIKVKIMYGVVIHNFGGQL